MHHPTPHTETIMDDTTRESRTAAPTTPACRLPASIDPSSTVIEVMQRHPGAVRVFNAFGVDACCGGAAPLSEAALDANVRIEVLLGALAGVIGDGGDAEATT
jgi:regulator of cell morphogenesis and NO signaling